MFNIGPLELMVILVIALLVIGPKRLPDVGRSVGRALREFRRAQDEVTRTITGGLDEEQDIESGEAVPGAQATGTSTGPEGSGPAPVDPTTDAVRTLGRSLAELRRAREELQRGFRVDLNELTRPAPPPRRTATTRPTPPPQPVTEETPPGPDVVPGQAAGTQE
ncbi:MAG TPA: twin-arginine translocase TatA/TatE family subunit [Actinomycetota bacterium]|nr:twin-arginine translocase TatA/TatE family subunit [Actinomycetota bacterium]